MYHASLLSGAAGSFKTIVLREGNSIICAATVRAFGTILAEIPFVGTKEDCRHGLLIFASQFWEHCLLWYSSYSPSGHGVYTVVWCRNQGALRTLFTAIEVVLSELGVRHIVIPSIRKLRRMWCDKFGFQQLTLEESMHHRPFSMKSGCT